MQTAILLGLVYAFAWSMDISPEAPLWTDQSYAVP